MTNKKISDLPSAQIATVSDEVELLQSGVSKRVTVALLNATPIPLTPIPFSFIQQIATNKLLGRGTAGTGSIEQITLGTGLTMAGTTLNASGGSGATSFGDGWDWATDISGLPNNSGLLFTSPLSLNTYMTIDDDLATGVTFALTTNNAIAFQSTVGDITLNGNNAVNLVSSGVALNLNTGSGISLHTANGTPIDIAADLANFSATGVGVIIASSGAGTNLSLSSSSSSGQVHIAADSDISLISATDGNIILTPGTGGRINLNGTDWSLIKGADVHTLAVASVNAFTGTILTFEDRSGLPSRPLMTLSDAPFVMRRTTGAANEKNWFLDSTVANTLSFQSRTDLNGVGTTFLQAVRTGTNIDSLAFTADNLNFVTSVQSTVGAAGGASALPATPSGYVHVQINGSNFQIPYYARV